MRYLLAFILSILFCLPANSATYYVSDCQSGADVNCVNGNDSNNGTSTATPWRTFAKAVTGIDSQPAGTTILFANGGVFSSSSTTDIFNQNVSAGSPLTISNYQPPWGSGDESRPRINCSGGGFNFEDGAASDPDGGYIISNLQLYGSRNGDGIRAYNDADDVTINNVIIDNFNIGVYQATFASISSGNGYCDRWNITNNIIRNNSQMGYLGIANYLLIQDNHFENNGSEITYDHNIYVSSGNNLTIKDNTLYKSTFVGGMCQSVSMVVHGTVTGLLIEGNTVYEDVGAAADNCYGIAVDTGYEGSTGGEGFDGAIIRNNIIRNVGAIGIGANAMPNGIIENNVIIQNNTGWFDGISVPDRDRSASDMSDNNMTIRNNSVYISSSQGAMGIRMSTEGTSHVVTNNIISYTGSSTFQCFDTSGLSSANFESLSNNICYVPNTTQVWGTNIGQSPVWSNPLFSSLSTLELASNSPAIGAGIASFASTLDISGATRPNPPSIGAWEFSTESPAGQFILHIFSGHGAVFH